MEVANVLQGTVLTSGGQTFVADKLVVNLLGVNFTQRQSLTGIGCLLVGFMLKD